MLKKTHQVYWRERRSKGRKVYSEGVTRTKAESTAFAKHYQSQYPDRIYWIDNIRKD